MLNDILPSVYDALLKLARQRLASERPGHTLQATALVHDVYLKLASESPERWKDTSHFYNAAAQAMRQVLVDYARARLADKRGGHRQRLPLSESMPDVATLSESADPEQVLALEQAIVRLESISPEAATVVKLRFFGGLTVQQTAIASGVSVMTVHRKWEYARLFLFRELSGK